jgi:hypothetical protein
VTCSSQSDVKVTARHVVGIIIDVAIELRCKHLVYCAEDEDVVVDRRTAHEWEGSSTSRSNHGQLQLRNSLHWLLAQRSTP